MEIEHVSELLGVSSPRVEGERLYSHVNIGRECECVFCVFRQMEMNGEAWGELVKRGSACSVSPCEDIVELITDGWRESSSLM